VILFSTGSGNLGNSDFVGVGDVSGQEPKVQQIVAAEATYTTMRCYVEKTVSSPLTFTLRDNGKDVTGLTCLIEANKTTGSGTGTATVKPGDLVDVATPGSNVPGAPGSFAISG
jgi:hypothetical protein